MLIWAHRGASADAPENTMAAFHAAVEQGADGVELDVHLSADGIPVVIHDETLDRTTTGFGPVVGASAGELSLLGVPRLTEVLALLAPTGMSVNVELKNNVEPYRGMEAAVLEACDGWGERVWFSSFHHPSMAELRRLDPDAQIGLLIDEVTPRLLERARLVGAQALHPHYTLLPKLAGCEFRLHAWTCTHPSRAAGADAVITNEPAITRALLERSGT